MIKITFLKKDETARKIYQTIWNNRNTWYLPYLRLAGGHFHGLHTYKTQTQLFVYEGCLYVERPKVNHVLINIPETTPAFTEDEINAVVETFKQAVADIKALNFEPTKNKDKACKYCNYKDYCGMNKL